MKKHIDFGKNVKYWLKERGASQSDLARYLNIPCVYVSRWVHNQTRPNYETLCDVAHFLGVSLETLLYSVIEPMEYKEEGE